jgi:hypothetical protein
VNSSHIVSKYVEMPLLIILLQEIYLFGSGSAGLGTSRALTGKRPIVWPCRPCFDRLSTNGVGVVQDAKKTVRAEPGVRMSGFSLLSVDPLHFLSRIWRAMAKTCLVPALPA